MRLSVSIFWSVGDNIDQNHPIQFMAPIKTINRRLSEALPNSEAFSTYMPESFRKRSGRCMLVLS